MTFETALISHMINKPDLNAIVKGNISNVILSTDDDFTFPAIVVKHEKEDRDVKTDRVCAIYTICCLSNFSEQTEIIEKLIYKEFKAFSGKLNHEFACSIGFKKNNRGYNYDSKYWGSYSQYSVAYTI